MKFPVWHVAQADCAAVERLTDAGYPYLVSGVLASRGVNCPEQATEYLTQETTLTHSPFLMKDMDKAAARIDRALSDGEKIAIFGDYDVDGITATCIMVDYLKGRGADVVHYIPRRIEDGYGLSCEAIEGLRKGGATLLVTVDCGITGVEEVAYARSIGMDVVVTDHHECKETLPVAAAVVDPRRTDCEYPFKHLAGCGVALKLVLALGGPDREEALFSRYCTLAAIGTVADVMQMTGENRTIVSRGLATIEGGVAELSPELNVMSVVTARLGRRMLSDVDWRSVLTQDAGALYESAHKSLEIPALIADILHTGLKGEANLGIEHHPGKDMAELVHSAVEKLCGALLGCGLLVTGALLRQTPPLAGELSVYSIVCFVLAAGAACWPYRKRKKK